MGRRPPSRRGLGPARRPQAPPGPPAGLQSLPCGPGKPRQVCGSALPSLPERGAGRGGVRPLPPPCRGAAGGGASATHSLAEGAAGGRGSGTRSRRTRARDGDWFRHCPGPRAGVRVWVTTLPGAGRTHRGRLRLAALPLPRLRASAPDPASACCRSARRVSMMEPARPTPRAPRHRWLRSAEHPAACVSRACAGASGLAARARLVHLRAERAQ